MFYAMVQTVCTIIIAIAAVKYLMPDIRKVCRMIADSGEVKEKKKKAEKTAETKKITEKKAAESKEKKEEKPEKIEAAENSDAEANTTGGDVAVNTADSDYPSEKEEREFPEWEE